MHASEISPSKTPIPSKLPVLMITHSSHHVGGGSLSTKFLLEGIDQAQFDYSIACIFPNADLVRLYELPGVRSFYWPGISLFSHTTGEWYSLGNPFDILRLLKNLYHFWPSVRATEKLVRSEKAPVVHVNSLSLVPSAIGVKRAGAKLVWHVRESVHPGHFGLRRFLVRSLVMRLADEVIFIAEDNRKQLVDHAKGVVIPEPVEEDRYHPDVDGKGVRRELGLSPSDRVLLFMGGMSRIKGAPVLLKTLQEVRRHLPELKVIIASGLAPQSASRIARLARKILPLLGAGTERQIFTRLYTEGKMEEYVTLLPFRNDPERLIAASDLVVFPSTEPHFGRPVVEAGAMAKPVVASRIGGVEEAVEEEATGLLVPPNDPVKLAEAILRVLTDPSLARRLGMGGYKRYQERYQSQLSTRATEEVYRRVLAAAPSERSKEGSSAKDERHE